MDTTFCNPRCSELVNLTSRYSKRVPFLNCQTLFYNSCNHKYTMIMSWKRSSVILCSWLIWICLHCCLAWLEYLQIFFFQKFSLSLQLLVFEKQKSKVAVRIACKIVCIYLVVPQQKYMRKLHARKRKV